MAVRNRRFRRIWIIVGIIALSLLLLVLLLIAIIAIRIPLTHRIDSEQGMSDSDNNDALTVITDFGIESTYLHYRDIITSNEQTEYEVRSSESDGFRFYFAQRRHGAPDTEESYPKYICYVKYNGTSPQDADMTLKYVYNKNNSWESSGEPSDKIMLLIGSPKSCRAG